MRLLGLQVVALAFFSVFWLHIKGAPNNSTEKSRWVFLQNDYDIVMQIGEITSYNHSYFRDIKATFAPYNRTQRVVNGSAHVIKEISNNTKVDLQVYKFMSNEYRFFPISITANPCFEFASNGLGFKEMLRNVSNFPGCPVKKGFYYIYNWLPDFSKFPPYMPQGQYKMTLKTYHKSDFLVEVSVYGTVKEKVAKWW